MKKLDGTKRWSREKGICQTELSTVTIVTKLEKKKKKSSLQSSFSNFNRSQGKPNCFYDV